MTAETSVLWFDEIDLKQIETVGGKNSSLGEMYQRLSGQGIRVPFGFATTAEMFQGFIKGNDLADPIAQQLARLKDNQQSLVETGANIRALILDAQFSDALHEAIVIGYRDLCEKTSTMNLAVAVRSSATAEDLPEASFAGQQDSFLNVRGPEALVNACQLCFASLYNDRAIVYREEQGFDQMLISLSVGVQQMVQADAAGVMFTLDTETGFPEAILINANWGLGETVVQGSVNPDRYMVYKPFLSDQSLSPLIEKTTGSKLVKMLYAEDEEKRVSVVDTSPEEQKTCVLNDSEILELARWGAVIEDHYQCPMDIEWARDLDGQELYILQARPETIESQKDRNVLVDYKLLEKAEPVLTGASVGSAIATGAVIKISDASQIDEFPDGAILVTERTDPDWVPLMRKANGIITDSGGPTSHAAIVSRELKVPAIVGTGDGTSVLNAGEEITLNCAGGSLGEVYAGKLPFETNEIQLSDIAETETDIMINVALPDSALHWWQLPVAGIGLTRIEFIISSQIRVHPMALLHPEKVMDDIQLDQIHELTAGFDQPADYFVENLARSIGKIAASRYPGPVIVRMSDFKSNEYRGLIGGEFFEAEEENPMLGFRGASRYYHPLYREGFQLECLAIKYARETMGFTNIIVMIPFCRTVGEADKVLETMAESGLTRGENGLEVYVMCEIPSNIILADKFAERFDGFSIGSNDLTQLVLGIDRDSAQLQSLFDARDEAVKSMIEQVITVAHRSGCKVGICGQAPSDHPEFAEFLVHCGIDSISLNPDSVLQASQQIALAESKNKAD